MAVGVSKVWGSAGMSAQRVWGSGGLLERQCEEKGRTKSAKEKLWEHCEELFRTILEEKSEKGEHRHHKSVQEILRGFEYDQKYRFFLCWLSWGPSGEVSGACWKLFRLILGSIFGTIERRKQKRRTSLPLEPARAGSTLARSETDEKATQRHLKTRPR